MKSNELVTCVVVAASVAWVDFMSDFVSRSLHYYHVKYFKEKSLASIDHSTGLSLSEPIENILNCSDISPKPRVERRGGFYLYYNYIQSRKYFRCHESVTFTTHLSLGTFDYLGKLAERWQGPVSVAVVVLKNDYDYILERIMHLRECDNPFVKDFVNFHFIFKDSDFPNEVFVPKEVPIYFKNICDLDNPWLENPKERKEELFSNLAHNVAITGSLTHFVVSSELYLYPSEDFVSKFLKFVYKDPNKVFAQLLLDDSSVPLKFSNLFVLPIFIIKRGRSLPQSKAELVRLRSRKEAALFSTDSSPFNQHFGKYNVWLAKEEDGMLDIVSYGQTKRFLYDWEPVYVGNKLEPTYDERLILKGPHSKYAKYAEMCVAGYYYHVLDDAYLLVKEEDAPYYRPDQSQNFENETHVERLQMEILKLKDIIEELRSVYPVWRHCSELIRKNF